jgi:hypothetical protein
VEENWSRLKVIVAKKLSEPQLAQIRLYDLRHFAGSMTYHKTKDMDGFQESLHLGRTSFSYCALIFTSSG